MISLGVARLRTRAVLPAFAVLSLILSGCASTKPAPVVERASPTSAKRASVKAAKSPDSRPQTYTVQKGDTLYGISLEHGFDYKEVAEWNGIEPPYLIKVGQQLKLTQQQAQPHAAQVVATPLKSMAVVENKATGTEGALLKTEPKAVKLPYSEQAAETPPAPPAAKPVPVVAAVSVAKPVPVVAAPQVPPPVAKPTEEKASTSTDDDDKLDWGWPTQGKVVAEFSDASSAKGVDISGKVGQSVNAAAAGKVVYSGSGLRGYGKLIIIKHNKTYLSAYAHNSQILVKEGQSIVKGQKIAEMGDSDADRVMLHFEIRRFGKPVDPMKYLSADSSA